jgi:hypothetical protein
LKDGQVTGYWEWFRKDGVRMRSGYYDRSQQVGEWTTYDRTGAVYKIIVMKATAAARRKWARKTTATLRDRAKSTVKTPPKKK